MKLLKLPGGPNICATVSASKYPLTSQEMGPALHINSAADTSPNVCGFALVVWVFTTEGLSAAAAPGCAQVLLKLLSPASRPELDRAKALASSSLANASALAVSPRLLVK